VVKYVYFTIFGYGHIPTSWSRVLEKLTGFQVVKKFLAFHGTRRFITAGTMPARSEAYSLIVS
jgi:hypothetical protein